MSLYDISIRYNININYLVSLLNQNQVYIQNIYYKLSDADIYRINDILARYNIIRPNYTYNYSYNNGTSSNKLLIITPIIIVAIIAGALILLYSGFFSTYTFKRHTDQSNAISFKTSAPKIEYDENKNVTYNWNYDNKNWSYTLEIPESYYDQYKHSSRNYPGVKKFTQLVTDDTDDKWLNTITQSFIEIGKKQGYSDSQIVQLVVSFVQNIEYQEDLEYTGKEEYPKYPCETLYDKGGDCEDSSILLASLLQEMGYDVSLFDIAYRDKDIGHMSVGIKGSNKMDGKYFNLAKDKYYYIETTAAGWDIGDMPDEYANAVVAVLKVSRGNKSFEP